MPDRPVQGSSRIALLVPCYNAAAHVGPFLASLDALSPGFDEVLFLDDGSGDDTADRLEAAGRRVIRCPENGGAAVARNLLWRDIRCDHVHFHDVDDPFSRPDLLSVLGPHLDGRSVVFGSTEFVELDRTTSLRPRHPDRIGVAPDSFVLTDVVHLNATIWPRAVLERTGGFRAELRTQQDIMLFIDAHARGVPLVHVDAVVARHIKSPTSTLQQKVPLEHDLQAVELCRLAAESLPAASANLVAEKAIYHLRRLALAGQLRPALDAMGQVSDLLQHASWPGGGRAERLLARLFGFRASLTYVAWRA